ncbi:MAG: hypothetical protein Q4F84_09410, partial [Fibrobacter sp.]|nr:hypothetical protein [Fibrobacter sp.]
MKILNIIEFVLFGILTCAFISGNISHDVIPYVFEFCSISILIYILITAYELRKNHKHTLPPSVSIGITILSIIAVQTYYHSEVETKIPLLYILVVSGISLLGKKKMWLFSCILIIFTEVTYNLYSVYKTDPTELGTMSLFIAKNAILPSILLLFT